MILIIDNHDSFTYNLVQAFLELGAEVEVRRNDAIDLRGVAALSPQALVLSPGPGRPEHAGITPRLIEHLAGSLPMLGVCLGHQAMGLVLGARVVRSQLPMHGRAEAIEHDGRGLFAGLPSPLRAGRYHSLTIDPASLPPGVAVRARGAGSSVMAIEHEELRLHGVQFHPESVLTPEGPRLLAAFLALARGAR